MNDNDTMNMAQIARIIEQLLDACDLDVELDPRLEALARRGIRELTSPPTPAELAAVCEFAEMAHRVAREAAQMN